MLPHPDVGTAPLTCYGQAPLVLDDDDVVPGVVVRPEYSSRLEDMLPHDSMLVFLE